MAKIKRGRASCGKIAFREPRHARIAAISAVTRGTRAFKIRPKLRLRPSTPAFGLRRRRRGRRKLQRGENLERVIVRFGHEHDAALAPAKQSRHHRRGSENQSAERDEPPLATPRNRLLHGDGGDDRGDGRPEKHEVMAHAHAREQHSCRDHDP